VISTLTPLQLPTDPADWSAYLTRCADEGLQATRAVVDELKNGDRRSAAEVVALWNDADLALKQAGSLAGVLAEVHPAESVRTLAEERSREVQRFATELGQDRAVYDVLATAEAELATDPATDPQSARLLHHALRDFRRAGVDRDEATRDRLRELAETEVRLGQDFSRVIRDDVRTIRVHPDRLAGLPADYLAAHPVADDGLVTLSTDYPDYVPLRSFASDADVRRELTVAFLNRGWPENDARLQELLATRAEHAQLLGYSGWPDFDAEIKMVGTGPAIAEFVDRIIDAARASGARDRDVLLARMRRDRPEANTIDAADATYYAELIRRENFDVDAQLVRQYFDFTRVRAGLLDVTGRLFGLRYQPIDAPSWHEDVAVYDVYRIDDDQLLGRIHLDLHPREGKFKHAAQFDLVAGVEGCTLPEGALVCNFSRGLVEHTDVVTLFHEFGHLVHHVLAGRQRFARFSGVATEWDFVEAPSQMLEEWAWDPEVLGTFAVNADGEPIPPELVGRMRAAKDFGKGYFACTQMFYAAVSYYLHAAPVDDLTAKVRELQAQYDAFAYIEGTHFHTSFGHLEGYTSGYYTYMWSLVIAKDMFSAFDPDDLFATAVAHRYRDTVLTGGGSRDAAELVAEFLGRPYGFDAFAAWLATDPTS
jgi:thimet oligopeptidase